MDIEDKMKNYYPDKLIHLLSFKEDIWLLQNRAHCAQLGLVGFSHSRNIQAKCVLNALDKILMFGCRYTVLYILLSSLIYHKLTLEPKPP